MSTLCYCGSSLSLSLLSRESTYRNLNLTKLEILCWDVWMKWASVWMIWKPVSTVHGAAPVCHGFENDLTQACRLFCALIPGISDLMNQAGLEGPGNTSGDVSSMAEPKGSPSNASQNSNNSAVL
jgi:hypothetical protein